jgi:hypothetical protein
VKRSPQEDISGLGRRLEGLLEKHFALQLVTIALLILFAIRVRERLQTLVVQRNTDTLARLPTGNLL